MSVSAGPVVVKELGEAHHTPSCHSISFSASPVPNTFSTSTSSPLWSFSTTSRRSPILTSLCLVKAAKSFFREIICIDMDPMRRKMAMKKVAGFHSLDFGFPSFAELDLSGFGTRDFQNDGCAIVGIALELAQRIPRAPIRTEASRKAGDPAPEGRKIRRRRASRPILRADINSRSGG